jgi:Ca2+-binding RTX toxin-like protein
MSRSRTVLGGKMIAARRLSTVPLALGLLLALAASAQAASTVRFDPREDFGPGNPEGASSVVVLGDDGANAVTVTRGSVYTVRDTSGVTAGKRCVQKGANTAECPSADYIAVGTGAGDDDLEIDSALAAFVETGDGNDTVTVGFGFVLGGAGNDAITLNAPAGTAAKFLEENRDLEFENRFDEQSLADGEAGDDLLTGGPDHEYLEGNDGTDQLDGGGGNDLVGGGSGSDQVRGGEGNDSLDGDPTLPPGEESFESDVVDGGPGSDTLLWGDRIAAVRVNLADNADPDGAENENDRVSGVEIAQTGAGVDTLIGTEANETFDPGGERDSVSGGGGSDTISYASSPDAVTVNLGDEPGTLDSLSGIDNAAGSSHDDVLVGDDGANALSGLEGNDSLVGGSGLDLLLGGDDDDLLDGGAGGDALNGGDSEDSADYSARSAAIFANLDTNGGEAGEGDTYDDVEVLLGGTADDTLTGTSAKGGMGDDTLTAEFGDGGPGNDRLKSMPKRGGDLEGGDGNDVLEGAGKFDDLEGDDGDDVLKGKGNADSLDGGLGDDVLNGGRGADDVSYFGRSERVRASTPSGGGQAGEKDAYTSIEGITGGKGNDVLKGRRGKRDELAGGRGNDRLNGLSGKDSLEGEEGADTLTAKDGQTDRVDCGSGKDSFRADKKDDLFDCERNLRRR